MEQQATPGSNLRLRMGLKTDKSSLLRTCLSHVHTLYPHLTRYELLITDLSLDTTVAMAAPHTFVEASDICITSGLQGDRQTTRDRCLYLTVCTCLSVPVCLSLCSYLYLYVSICSCLSVHVLRCLYLPVCLSICPADSALTAEISRWVGLREQHRRRYQPRTAFAKCLCSCAVLLRNGPMPFAWWRR